MNQKDHAQVHILPDVRSWLKPGPAGLLKKSESAREKEVFCEKKSFTIRFVFRLKEQFHLFKDMLTLQRK